MSFKTTVNQQQIATDLAAAARTLAQEVKEAFEQRVAPFLREGEAMPDLGLLQELLSRWLMDSGQQVLAIDDRYSATLRDRLELTSRREELDAALRLRLRDARNLLDRHFGEKRSRRLFPERNLTVPTSVRLIRTSRQAIEVLRDPSLSWQALAQSGLGADHEALATVLEAECNELEQFVDLTLKEQKRQRLQSLGAKVAELRENAEVARKGANFLAGLYELVGLDFQAKRLRMRRRRAAKQEEGTQGEPPPEGTMVPAATPGVALVLN